MNFLHFEVAEDAAGAPVVLGRGAMGVTYKARDRNLDCPVALKVIAPGLVADRITRERFLREARTAAALRHPNVATVLFLGEHDGEVFYAMEFVDGRTLEEEIRRSGPLPSVMVRVIGIEVARALVAAQKVGLVHRDIKPSNILLTHRDGGLAVKLVDFGLAKLLGGDFTGETLAAASAAGFQGTPHFASPEQINGEETGITSDIYSLGATLFAALAGRVPFEGSLAQVLSKHLNLEPPLEALPDSAAAFRPVLARMLAKSSADRYQSASELREALEGIEITPVAAVPDDPFATLMMGAVETWERGREISGYRLDGAVTVLTHATIHRAVGASGRPVGLLPMAAIPGRTPDPAAALKSLRGKPGLISCEIPEGCPGVVVTDWVEAPTLRRRIEAGGLMERDEILALLRIIASGLDAMEAAGVPMPRLDSGDILIQQPKGGARTSVFLPIPGEWLAAPSADRTMAPAAPQPGSPAATLVPLVSELLGGLHSGAGFRPLPNLDAVGNDLLRDALHGSARGPAIALVEQLAPRISSVSRPSPGPVLPTPAKVLTRQSSPTKPQPTKRRMATVWIALFAVVLLALSVALILLAPRILRTLTVLRTEPVAAASPTPVATPRASPTPEAAPTPTLPDLVADAISEATAAAKRGDYAAALDRLEVAASLADDPSTVLSRTEMVAALLRSDAFTMTSRKFDELRPGLELAAGRGVLSAQMLLGENLRSRSPATSLAWFTRAAAAGQTEAMTQAGLMLAAGAGVPTPDLPAAVNWFRQGAAGGDTDAMVALADCLIRGKGTDQNLPEALDLLRSAAAFQHPAGLVLLAQLTKTGIPGVLPPDLNEAFRLFQNAADRGSLEGQANVGVFYVNGWGTPKDPGKAMQLWKEGATLGDPTSMFFYAQGLEGGIHGKPDPSQAREFYIRAAQKGNASAREWCRKKRIELP
ncbi:MAG: hypothetical protein Fur0032_07970 [Terrimicrobiaceae bacterium]